MMMMICVAAAITRMPMMSPCRTTTSGCRVGRQRTRWLLLAVVQLCSGFSKSSFLFRPGNALMLTNHRLLTKSLNRDSWFVRRNNEFSTYRCYDESVTKRHRYIDGRRRVRSVVTLNDGHRENADADSTFRYHRNSNIQRVFCLSDLHADHHVNMQWVRDRMKSSRADTTMSLNQSDLLIVAGDISHDISIFTETLQILREQCQVFFVPGNHEAWSIPTSNKERRRSLTVLEKLKQCRNVCEDLGVYVDPVYLDGGPHPVWILPLESWYDGSLSFDEELCKGFEYWPWADFKRCNWGVQFPEMPPPNARIPYGLTEYFLECNRINILEPWQEMVATTAPSLRSGSGPDVITVSHFAPNQQCLPDWKDLQSTTFLSDQWLDHGAGPMSAKFAKVAGSALLDQQIRNMTVIPKIHIFGHSHRPKDFTYQNVRYVHNPLGKPRERELHMVSPSVDFQYLWNVLGDDTNVNNNNDVGGGQIWGEPIIRYWEDYGGGKEMLWKRMGEVRPGRYQHDGTATTLTENEPRSK